MSKKTKKITWSESFGFMSAPASEDEAAAQLRFITEVERESTRGAVLTIVSYIDELLVDLLKLYLPNKAHVAELVKRLEGCLSTIVYRADIAFALALLRKREYELIKILAKIRNEFAHNWEGEVFDSKDVAALADKLRGKFQHVDGTNKAMFNCAASEIVQQLQQRRIYAARLGDRLPKEYRDAFDPK